MIRVALDAMGGDHAPQAEVEGALAALALLPNVIVQLVGQAEVIEAELARHPGADRSRLEVVAATEVIGMAEKPLAAVRKKPNSSLVVGLGLQKAGKSDAFISAGNTGAVLAAVHRAPRPPPGRRARHRRHAVPDRRPSRARPRRRRQRRLLRQGAGRLRPSRHRSTPATSSAASARSSDSSTSARRTRRGTPRSQEAHELLKQTPGPQLHRQHRGARHPRRPLEGTATSTWWCATASSATSCSSSTSRWPASSCGWSSATRPDILDRADVQEVFRVLDYSEYGGAPLLGVRGVSIICHGSSGTATPSRTPSGSRCRSVADRAQPAHRRGVRRGRRARRMIRRPIAAFAGLGVAVPDRVVTNADFEQDARHLRPVDRASAPASGSAASPGRSETVAMLAQRGGARGA